MNVNFVVFGVIVVVSCFVASVNSIWCYACHSSHPGCGKELSIRLQRWQWCQDPGRGGGENFCIKVIENRGGEEYITRDCLTRLRTQTRHRERLPTIQRHGYCEYARNNDPKTPYNQRTKYCFCNDFNGCNTGRSLTSSLALSLLSPILVFVLYKL